MNYSIKRATSFPTLFVLFTALLSLTQTHYVAAQSQRPADAKKTSSKTNVTAPQPPELKRTTTRRETKRFPFGGRVTIYGAPQGSLTIEAWPRGEVEITADIELTADTEEELSQLAAVNTFHLDDDVNHLRVLTVGTHDRKYMKRIARNFPKKLLAAAWKIDYRIRVPAQTDLEINAGNGPLTIKDVEGAIRLNAGESEQATLVLTGGDVEATLAGGEVNLNIPTRGWRGRGLSLRLARGDINLSLPSGFNGYINAEVLAAGRILNEHPELKPAERTTPTERVLRGQSGAGGANISLTAGSGTIRIMQARQ